MFISFQDILILHGGSQPFAYCSLNDGISSASRPAQRLWAVMWLCRGAVQQRLATLNNACTKQNRMIISCEACGWPSLFFLLAFPTVFLWPSHAPWLIRTLWMPCSHFVSYVWVWGKHPVMFSVSSLKLYVVCDSLAFGRKYFWSVLIKWNLELYL